MHFEGAKAKVSKEVLVGAELQIRQGWDEKTIIIKALSEQRRGAPEAEQLYEETPESIALRLEQAEQRRAMRVDGGYQNMRPTKKGRRQIHRFKQQNLD